LAFTLAAASFLAGQAVAKPIVYPSKGQSAQQQEKDEGECYAWAKSRTGHTGIDPAAATAAPAPAPETGPAVGGSERVQGVVAGAVIGGTIDGGSRAGKGAAIGVVAGRAGARHDQQSRNVQA
jgi:hypothetical protein